MADSDDKLRALGHGARRTGGSDADMLWSLNEKVDLALQELVRLKTEVKGQARLEAEFISLRTQFHEERRRDDDERRRQADALEKVAREAAANTASLGRDIKEAIAKQSSEHDKDLGAAVQALAARADKQDEARKADAAKIEALQKENVSFGTYLKIATGVLGILIPGAIALGIRLAAH